MTEDAQESPQTRSTAPKKETRGTNNDKSNAMYETTDAQKFVE